MARRWRERCGGPRRASLRWRCHWPHLRCRWQGVACRVMRQATPPANSRTPHPCTAPSHLDRPLTTWWRGGVAQAVVETVAMAGGRARAAAGGGAGEVGPLEATRRGVEEGAEPEDGDEAVWRRRRERFHARYLAEEPRAALRRAATFAEEAREQNSGLVGRSHTRHPSRDELSTARRAAAEPPPPPPRPAAAAVRAALSAHEAWAEAEAQEREEVEARARATLLAHSHPSPSQPALLGSPLLSPLPQGSPPRRPWSQPRPSPPIRPAPGALFAVPVTHKHRAAISNAAATERASHPAPRGGASARACGTSGRGGGEGGGDAAAAGCGGGSSLRQGCCDGDRVAEPKARVLAPAELRARAKVRLPPCLAPSSPSRLRLAASEHARSSPTFGPTRFLAG